MEAGEREEKRKLKREGKEGKGLREERSEEGETQLSSTPIVFQPQLPERPKQTQLKSCPVEPHQLTRLEERVTRWPSYCDSKIVNRHR